MMFTLNWNDVTKGLITAFFVGLALPILAAIQTPGFDLFTANWNAIFMLALNSGLAGFAGYLTKNFFSDQNGRFGGIIG